MRRVFWAAASVLLPMSADAHSVGLSRGEWALRGGRLEAHLVFARPELVSLAPGADADRDGSISAGEANAAKEEIRAAIVDRIVVSAGGTKCAGELDRVVLEEEDGIALDASWKCVEGPADVDLAMLDDLAFGHRHLAQLVTSTSTQVVIAFRDNRAFRIDPLAAHSSSFAALFRLGIEHILTGWDHLVFLIGLILVGGKFRSLLGVVTAFTIGHSVTLGLAALDVWAPSPSIIEPAIALSIAYVGVENFFVQDAHKRWRITLPFGLIHGFGFAGALREISLPTEEIPKALLAFNLGVEAGQVAILAVALPLVMALRARLGTLWVQIASAAIIAAGLYWFVTRIL